MGGHGVDTVSRPLAQSAQRGRLVPAVLASRFCSCFADVEGIVGGGAADVGAVALAVFTRARFGDVLVLVDVVFALVIALGHVQYLPVGRFAKPVCDYPVATTAHRIRFAGGPPGKARVG